MILNNDKVQDHKIYPLSSDYSDNIVGNRPSNSELQYCDMS